MTISNKHKLLVELFFVGYFFILPLLLLVTGSIISMGAYFLVSPLVLFYISKSRPININNGGK